VKFEIGPGFSIGVKGYIYFKPQEIARSSYVYLGGEKAVIAKGKTELLSEHTTRTVEKAEIRKAFKFGGAQVSFTPEELASIRNFGDPVIRIIGFKPLSMLPIWANLKQSTFIYPSEEDFIGSTRVFSALHGKLLKDQKMGLAWFIARRNAAPVIAAIIPGAEELGEHGEQIRPAGLWLIPLPFADDIRQNPETLLVRSPDSLVDKMRVVVQQLQLPKARYMPDKYPNPALQWHYRILQAIALDEDLPEVPDDKTVPKYRQIDKRAGEYVVDWGHELENAYTSWQRTNGGRAAAVTAKRPASSAAGPAAKKVKTELASEGDAMNDKAIQSFIVQNATGKVCSPCTI
jgi:ATP-dependent DNA helicase 2 subunit 1